MGDSQHIRSSKRAFKGSNNSALTEYSSGVDSANEMTDRISNYNTHGSDFDRETLIRSNATERFESYNRNNSYNTIKEDIGESTADGLFTRRRYKSAPTTFALDAFHANNNNNHNTNNNNADDTTSYTHIFLILVLILILTGGALLLYKEYKKHTEKIQKEKDKRIEGDYETMMHKLNLEQ